MSRDSDSFQTRAYDPRGKANVAWTVVHDLSAAVAAAGTAGISVYLLADNP